MKWFLPLIVLYMLGVMLLIAVRHPHPRDEWTFRLPLTLLMCLDYQPEESVVIKDWYFDQSVRIQAPLWGGKVTLDHDYGAHAEGCKYASGFKKDGGVW